MNMRLRRGMPYWLDNATRDKGLAVMSFEDGKAVVAELGPGDNVAHILAVGDTLQVDGATWRVVEVVRGESVLLEEVQ